MKQESKINSWITFIAVLLFLVGIYGSVRTGINLYAFEKYPQEGVIAFPGMPPVYPSREQDCSYPQIYYMADGKTTRPATDEEKQNEKIQKENCISSVKEARDRAKINDISQSLLFLFLGTGILISRRIFFK